METEKNGHIVELQSLRGLAATLVLVGHALSYYEAPLWFENLKDLSNGHAAVVMFYLLSGYVLVRSLASRPIDGPNVAAFYVKRLFRIYPALWVASIVGLLYLVFLHYNIPVAGTSEWFNERFRAERMHPLYIIASFCGMLAFILPQIWSITVEIFASVLMPGFAVLRLRRPGWFWLLLVALLIASFVIGPFTYYAIGVYMVDFVIGASLFGLPSGVGRFVAGLGRLRYWLFAVAAIVLVAGRDATTTFITDVDFHAPGFQLIEAVCAAAIMLLLIHGKVQLGLLRWRPVVVLGNISYSLYLWSFPVMCLIAKAFAVGFPLLSWQPSNVLQNILLATLTLVLTIPLSMLSYDYVERPGITLGGRALRILQRAWASPSPQQPAKLRPLKG